MCSYGSGAFRGHWASSASLHPWVGRGWWGFRVRNDCTGALLVCVCVILYCVCFIAHYRGDRDVEKNGTAGGCGQR